MTNETKQPAQDLPRDGRLRNRSGFTLTEVMIALLVFGIGLVGLAAALPNGMQSREKARRMSVATFLTKEQVERLRSLSFDDGDLAAGVHTDPTNPIDGVFRRRWQVQDNSPLPGMKRVTVSTSFITDSADSQAVSVTQLTR